MKRLRKKIVASLGQSLSLEILESLNDKENLLMTRGEQNDQQEPIHLNVF